MGLALLVIGLWVLIGVVFGGLKNGKKGSSEYGVLGAGVGFIILNLFQFLSPIIAIIFVVYLI